MVKITKKYDFSPFPNPFPSFAPLKLRESEGGKGLISYDKLRHECGDI
jgi:hypothetical protein